LKKNLMLVSVFIILISFLLAGCSSEYTSKINNVSDLEGKVIGTVQPVVSTSNMEKSIINAIGAEPQSVEYYNRYSDCVSAVLAGKVDAVFAPRFCAEYSMQRNSSLKVVADNAYPVNVVMAVRSEDQQLKNELDEAITVLQENGTLDSLKDQWVTNLPVGSEPESKEISKIEGAKTIYVGVCGDYVPLDYIATNGQPAGYNVALLSEIGKLMNINFEFVSIETQARFAALESKKIDLIFCNLQANSAALKALKNNSWIATMPYFTSEAGCFLVKD